MNRRRALIAAALAALIVAPACKSDQEKTEKDKKTEEETKKEQKAGDGTAEEEPEKVTLTIYSGRSEKLIGPVIDKFDKEHDNIDVRVKYGKSQAMATAVIKEGEKSPADVFVSQDAGTLGFLENKGVLSDLPKDLLSKVDARFRSGDGKWVGVTGRSRALVYNTENVKAADLPASVEELVKPRWKGRVGWPPENASFKAFVSAMIQLRDEAFAKKWLEQMKANEPKAYPKNTPAVRAVAKGEIDVALVNHYYLYRIKDEMGGAPIKNHYFKNGQAGSLVNVSGAGLLASSKHEDAGVRFIDFLLGTDAQKHFAKENAEFPLIEGVEVKQDLPSISELKAPELNLTELSHLETTEKLLRETDVLP